MTPKTDKTETPKPVRSSELVRRAIPDMNERKRYRYELAMPLVLTLDLDEQFGPDEIMALYRRVMKEEIRINISGCNSTGCYELYCNVAAPNVGAKARHPETPANQ